MHKDYYFKSKSSVVDGYISGLWSKTRVKVSAHQSDLFLRDMETRLV